MMAEYKYQNTTQDDDGSYDQLTDKPATGRNVLWSDNPSKAGAGRGKQGGPTAKELQQYEDKQNKDIFTEGKKVPQDIDGGSAPRKKKMASGGMTASKRADGIAQRGKTRGKMC